MKWRYVLMIAVFSFTSAAAIAQQAQPAAAAPQQKYVVVNGKKFFLMQNARRFNGSGGLTPSALGVVNHPHQPGVVAHRTAAPTPSYNGSDDGPSKSKQNDVLSVFAPTER